MKTFSFAQRSPEWHEQRAKCLLTASDAGAFLLKNDQRSRDARRSRILKYLTRDCYTGGDARLLDLKEKKAKILDYDIAVIRGNELEPDARNAFIALSGLAVSEVGLITTDDGLFGGSPDGLIGGDAGLECKVPLPETHLGYLIEHAETGQMVGDYLYQVHMNLAVSGRDIWHFYSHAMPFLDFDGNVQQDPGLWIEVKADKLTEQILRGLDTFRAELRQVQDILASQPATPGKEAAA